MEKATQPYELPAPASLVGVDAPPCARVVVGCEGRGVSHDFLAGVIIGACLATMALYALSLFDSDPPCC